MVRIKIRVEVHLNFQAFTNNLKLVVNLIVMHMRSSSWIPQCEIPAVAVDRRYAAPQRDSTWTVGYPDVSMTSWDSQSNGIYLVKLSTRRGEFQYIVMH